MVPFIDVSAFFPDQLDGVEPFEPFLFGDHLWATTIRFVEFHGLTHLRPPRGPVRPQAAQP